MENNAIVKRRRTEEQTNIEKSLHRKLKVEICIPKNLFFNLEIYEKINI
jgi:hypothetical protein